jgi:hypothetical protein
MNAAMPHLGVMWAKEKQLKKLQKKEMSAVENAITNLKAFILYKKM